MLSSAPFELPAGHVIGRDYKIERLLSEGGMGAVYVAEQLSTRRRRALKVMHPRLVPDDKSRARFREEAAVGSRIPSEHVVEVLAAGVDADTGVPWLAMELLEGMDLDELVRQRGALPAEAVRQIFAQMGHALQAAHRQGIVHRDLKPENLFLAETRRSDADKTIKILDFGIAKSVEAAKTAATVTSAIGSPLWMAPEQGSPGAQLRPSTDVWALGLLAFYFLTGRYYWFHANAEDISLQALLVDVMVNPLVPASQRADQLGCAHLLPPGFDAWFARCVVREPEARFAEAGEAVRALQAVLTAQPVASGARDGRTAHLDEHLARQASLSGLESGTTRLPPGSDAGSSDAGSTSPRSSRLGLLVGAGGLVLFAVAAVVALGITMADEEEPPSVAAASDPQSLARQAGDEAPPSGAGAALPGGGSGSMGAGVAVASDLSEAPADPASGEGSGTDDPASSARPGPQGSALAARGHLSVNTTPHTTVFVDDQHIGATPQVNISLPPGRHTLLMVNHDHGIRETRTVTIRSGERERVVFDFSPTAGERRRGRRASSGGSRGDRGSGGRAGGDDIDSLLDQASTSDGRAPTGPDDDRPATPRSTSIVSAMNSVSGRVQACGNGEHGLAPVRIVFRSDGRVQNAHVSGGSFSAPVRSCIARAVRGARVEPFRQSTFSVNYPFRL